MFKPLCPAFIFFQSCTAQMPPPIGTKTFVYQTYEELSDSVRILYGVLGYKLRILRSKKDSAGVTKKVWLSCEFHGVRKRETGCTFVIITTRIDQGWQISEIKGSHNHLPGIGVPGFVAPDDLAEQEMAITNSFFQQSQTELEIKPEEPQLKENRKRKLDNISSNDSTQAEGLHSPSVQSLPHKIPKKISVKQGQKTDLFGAAQIEE